jgi:preprotein translocase subunit SecD
LRRNLWILFGIIIVIVILAGLVDWPTGPNISIGSFQREIKVHEGLDLQGGVQLVYQLDTSKINSKDVSAAAQSVINVIERRVNSLGVSEPVIQSAKIGSNQAVIVQLPGITNVNDAINLIGKTAQLKFQDQSSNSQWQDTGLTGADLKSATVEFDKNTGEPEVSIQFNGDGTKKFADITQRDLQKQVAIVLDNEIISAPTVQTAITDGQAVITGQFTISEARQLSIELNAGALPVPINLVQQTSVGATLGSDSVQKSLMAGIVGLFFVALFMILYYKVPGALATIALLIYALVVLALFKLIPVTLTLAGIAGFILSVGMAVDANILIFERTKEELAAGKTIGLAIEDGFKRAWSSIRDSNSSSLITAAILYYGTTGLIRGFAVTLALGIIISMFTAITVTRTFLRLGIGTFLEKRLVVK